MKIKMKLSFIVILTACIGFTIQEEPCKEIGCLVKAIDNNRRAKQVHTEFDEKVMSYLADLSKIGRKPWKQVGTLKEFSELLHKYTLFDYEWGIAYNTAEPQSIIINYWDRGMRITGATLYPQGDDVNSLRAGTFMFTYLTDDKDTQGCKDKLDLSPAWYHNYIDKDLMYTGESNGCTDNRAIAIYVRRR